LTLGVIAAVAASSSASDNVYPGVYGFLIVAGIGVALFFLLRSMNKQIRKVTPPPGDDGGEEAEDPAEDPQAPAETPK
jgi:hypothetical protein